MYAVRFTAVDEAGNYIALDPVYIRVTGDDGGNAGLIIGLSIGGAAIVAAAVVLTVVLVKKNKKKKADKASETDTDETFETETDAGETSETETDADDASEQ